MPPKRRLMHNSTRLWRYKKQPFAKVSFLSNCSIRCIATVIRPSSGTITINGREIPSLKGAALAEYRGKEIGYLFQNFELLVDAPEGAKKQKPAPVYALSALLGMGCLAAAYAMAIRGPAWSKVGMMGVTLLLGLAGTGLLFWGLRFPIGLAVKAGKRDRGLHVFNFRQIQETVIQRSGTLAVCSLLILAALCCFGAGTAISRFYGESEKHMLDYTFNESWEEKGTSVRQTLEEHGLAECFEELFEMKVGHIRTAEERDRAFQMETVMDALRELPPSGDRDVLLNNLGYATNPYLIAMSSYNTLLSAAELHVTLCREDGRTVLRIRDNGIGVRSCDLPYIFEKGFTGDTGTERKKATGMGLYLAKEIARELNILPEAQSVWGEGFEMRLSFPVVDEVKG